MSTTPKELIEAIQEVFSKEDKKIVNQVLKYVENKLNNTVDAEGDLIDIIDSMESDE